MIRMRFGKRYVGLRDPEAVTALESCSYIRNVEKGEKIIREGDIVTEVAFIISGVLKAVYIDQYGKKKYIVLDTYPGRRQFLSHTWELE